jgi:hypothetical protein
MFQREPRGLVVVVVVVVVVVYESILNVPYNFYFHLNPLIGFGDENCG